MAIREKSGVISKKIEGNPLDPEKIEKEKKVAEKEEAKKEATPLIKLNQNDQYLHVKKSEDYKQNIKENKSIVVSAVNFQKLVDTDTEFDFTSFVKSVSRKNTAVAKFIRDNWTIVLSIRNQLEINN